MVNKWPCLPQMCACVELWKAVAIFGSFNVVYSAFMVGAYSYATNKELGSSPLQSGALSYQAAVKLCVAFYCLEIIFSVVLVYGAHRRVIVCLRAFFYYALMVSVVSLMLQASQFFTMTSRSLDYVLLGHAFFGTVFQVYLMFMTKSLLNRFNPTVHQQFENQLDEVVVREWSGSALDPLASGAVVEEPLPNQVMLHTKVQLRNKSRNGDRRPIMIEEVS